MRDDVLLINSISQPRLTPMHYFHASFTLHAGSLFNFYPLGNICILKVRLDGEIDQQNVIMHKAYSSRGNFRPALRF